MSLSLQRAIEACAAPEHYSNMYGCLSGQAGLTVDLKSQDVSRALFLHLCKIKYAAWKHKVLFKRGQRHSLAEVFQDLFAFYLRASLPNNYEISLEEPRVLFRNGKKLTIKPDICIKLNGRVECVIEAKTTIGWARPDYKLPEHQIYQKMQDRIDDVAASFEIDPCRVLFVLEEPTNVSRKFISEFWDIKNSVPTRRPVSGTLSHIYPLYVGTDPFYWKWRKKLPEGRQTSDWFISELSDAEILEKSATSIVTPFEYLLQFILNQSPIESHQVKAGPVDYK